MIDRYCKQTGKDENERTTKVQDLKIVLIRCCRMSGSGGSDTYVPLPNKV